MPADSEENVTEAVPEALLQASIFDVWVPAFDRYAWYWNTWVSPLHDIWIEDGPAVHVTPPDACVPDARNNPDTNTRTSAKAAAAPATGRGLVATLSISTRV
ncbi:MAG: hypothetical protein OXM57_03265 [bacterium]|nr:hypothetical protein [bacterium]MDE0351691.1 hypothetical protein [bacterium]